MENLPFLSKPLDIRTPPMPTGPMNPDNQPANEWMHEPPPPSPPRRRFEPMTQQQAKPNLAELFSDNRISFILLGIVIGVIIMNMRPVVLHTKGV